MIKTHDFNTRWWGKPVGIVTETRFFDTPASDQEQLLAQFDWVEYRMPLEHPPVDLVAVHRAGFFQVDTQINYRLNLTKLDAPSSLESLTVEFADEVPFEVHGSDIKAFEHERYLRLPGATEERVNERYALWSQQHRVQHPTTSLRIRSGERVEGWYFGDANAGVGLNLTLAMLSRESDISGLLLFLKAYHAFAERGHRLGWASFSVQNSAVHNIYAAIGARFINPIGHWLWIA